MVTYKIEQRIRQIYLTSHPFTSDGVSVPVQQRMVYFIQLTRMGGTVVKYTFSDAFAWSDLYTLDSLGMWKFWMFFFLLNI